MARNLDKRETDELVDPHEHDVYEHAEHLPVAVYGLSPAEEVLQDAAHWHRFYERGLHDDAESALREANLVITRLMDQLTYGIEYLAKTTAVEPRTTSPSGIAKLTDDALRAAFLERLPASTAALKRAGIGSQERIDAMGESLVAEGLVYRHVAGRNAEWRRSG